MEEPDEWVVLCHTRRRPHVDYIDSGSPKATVGGSGPCQAVLDTTCRIPDAPTHLWRDTVTHHTLKPSYAGA